MKSVEEFSEIYLYRFSVDMRKYRNALCAIVQEKMERNVFTDALFIFTNKTRRIIRFLYWDKTGFEVWTKALDKQKYRWPRELFDEINLKITSAQLKLLLQGIDITHHKSIEYAAVF